MIIDASMKIAKCPNCGTGSKRHSTANRTIKDLDGTITVKVSKHWCSSCRKHFSIQPLFASGYGSRYSHRLKEYILNLSTVSGYESDPKEIKKHLRNRFGVNVPYNTIRDMLEDNGLLKPSRSTKLENNFNISEFNRRRANVMAAGNIEMGDN